tara:strand:+ start:729 stop:1055 length:327 start_codon:yes stop_codon:yes gene_type:complete
MANNFDRAILDGTNLAADTLRSLYTCPTSTTTKTVGIGLIFSNVGSSQILVSLSTNGVETMKNVPVPSGSSLEYFGGNKIVMKSGDTISVKADTANSLNVYFSYMEIT